MDRIDRALLDQTKREIGNLNQYAADLGKARDAVIASMLHLAAIVRTIENKDQTGGG